MRIYLGGMQEKRTNCRNMYNADAHPDCFRLSPDR